MNFAGWSRYAFEHDLADALRYWGFSLHVPSNDAWCREYVVGYSHRPSSCSYVKPKHALNASAMLCASDGRRLSSALTWPQRLDTQLAPEAE